MTFVTFSFPTTALFGAGVLSELAERLQVLRIQRPLVVTDPGLLSTRSFELLEQTLGEKKKGKTWFLYYGVHPNPIEQDVVDAAETFRASDCDGVIAIGGRRPPGGGQSARAPPRAPRFSPAQRYL